MKKILAIGASNSSRSINKQFAIYVGQQIQHVELQIADLNELELPLFNPDIEKKQGIPDNAHRFSQLISDSNGIILSLAEYNGMITSAFKNLWDWTSRLDMNVWKNKPMLLMAASPGGRGGRSALNITKTLLPHFGGNVIAEFSLPKFHHNFSPQGITNKELSEELNQKVDLFKKAI